MIFSESKTYFLVIKLLMIIFIMAGLKNYLNMFFKSILCSEIKLFDNCECLVSTE